MTQKQTLAAFLKSFRATSVRRGGRHLPDVILLRRLLLPDEVHCSRLDRLLFSETHEVGNTLLAQEKGFLACR